MKAIIGVTIASMRTAPSDKAGLTDEALYGSIVDVIEECDQKEYPGDWVKIRTGYRYEGYVKRSNLVLNKKRVAFWLTKNLKCVYQAYMDVLSLPKVQGICMQEITRGGLISLLGKAIVMEDGKEVSKDGWLRVGLADGREGFIKEKFIGDYIIKPVLQEDELRRQVIDTAKTYLGTQYRWGGKSPLGIDCSGLTSMSYLLNGVVTYRDAEIKEGFAVHEIAFEDKKPGDLLYFPGHIVMYIGNDKYIHSTGKNGSDGVVINSLNPEDDDYRDDLPGKLLATGSVFPLK